MEFMPDNVLPMDQVQGVACVGEGWTQVDESQLGDGIDLELNSISHNPTSRFFDDPSESTQATLDSMNETGRLVADEPDDYIDDFVEDLDDPNCVQRIYDFCRTQVRGMVDYNDEDDVIQEVFYRLAKWPIGKKYNSTRHYFSLLKITIRQAIAAYWRRRHSQRNDARKRVFISELIQDGSQFDFAGTGQSDSLNRYHIKELVRLVLQYAKTLPPKQRAVFNLRFIQEKSHEEIASLLEISIRTSYRLETKVREQLQARFVGESDVAIVWSID